MPLIEARVKHDLPDTPEHALHHEYIRKVIHFLRTNEENFCSLGPLTKGAFNFFWTSPKNAQKVLQILPEAQAKELLEKSMVLLKKANGGYNENDWKGIVSDSEVPNPLFKLIRLSMIDQHTGPPIRELFEFFGLDESLKRLTRMQLMLSTR